MKFFTLSHKDHTTLDAVYRAIREEFPHDASIDEIESVAFLICDRNSFNRKASVKDAKHPIRLRGIARW